VTSGAEVAVAAAVIVQDRRVLLVRRRVPELAEALAAPGRPLTPEATFTRFLNRLIDGLDTD
jgi:hypothetical protein